LLDVDDIVGHGGPIFARTATEFVELEIGALVRKLALEVAIRFEGALDLALRQIRIENEEARVRTAAVARASAPMG
jgi:hypothetical protein